MTFNRLTRGDLLAMIAALALLLVMAMDWYTTKVGESARDVQKKVLPQLNRIDPPNISQQAAEEAESQEKNAWQADGAIDRVIVVVLLGAIGLSIFAAWARASGRTLGPPSPSALATVVGLVACLLIVYRILQPPGLNAGAVVKAGAPLGLLCAGLLTVGARFATVREREGRVPPASAPAGTGEPTPGGGDPSP